MPEHGFSLGVFSFSMSSVFNPPLAVYFAVVDPAMPPPTMITSYSCTRSIIVFLLLTRYTLVE